MKLYTATLSPFSAKVRIALREKKLPFEEVVLPFTRQGFAHKPPEMLAINPRGQVPTLIDGDVELYDSTIILEYLNERYPETPLYPADPAARVRARLLEDDADALLTGPLAELTEELFRKTDPGQRDTARIQAATAATHRVLGRWERALAEGPWLAGEYGVADIACFVPASFAAFFGAGPGPAEPKLAAWLARVGQRPSIAAETAAMTAAVQALQS